MKQFKRALSLCVAILLLTGAALPLTAAAMPIEGVYAYVVNTSWLNIRSGPGLGYDVLGQALRGEAVQILSYESGSTWVSARIVSSGIVGFMDSTYLAGSPAASTPPPVLPTDLPIIPMISPPINMRAVVKNPVATQFLNLRQYASYSAPVLGIYYNGTQMTVLNETDGWYYVQMDSGLRGYFRREFVSFDIDSSGSGHPSIIDTAVITSSGGRVNVRQGPGYHYTVIASYYPGKVVSVYAKPGTFWQVSVDGLIGYIDRNFLRSTGGGGSGGGSGTGNATVKGSGRLNLRAQPNSSARVISQYAPGTSVKVTAQGLDWCAVTIPSTGAKGYFMTKYLRLSGLPEIPTKVVKNNGSYVNLRGGASQSAGVTVRVPHNSVVTILSPPSGGWSRVKFGMVTGYMMSSFLK